MVIGLTVHVAVVAAIPAMNREEPNRVDRLSILLFA
jgi:hypothetical protein